MALTFGCVRSSGVCSCRRSVSHPFMTDSLEMRTARMSGTGFVVTFRLASVVSRFDRNATSRFPKVVKVGRRKGGY